jgi:protocatechuate 3,4-dioxygenase beta subunit
VHLILFASILTVAASAGPVTVPTGDEPVVGGPCEGCELVFVGMPDDFESDVRIAPAGEPGEPLRIEGRVVHPDGRPAPGSVLYAYHTDDQGLYPDADASNHAERRHGTLRAWAVADDDGYYVFRTIRPASYPDSSNPQHVHLHVIEPGRCTYWVASVVFTDDPLLDDTAANEGGRGGNGATTPRRDEHGVWVVKRDVVLGQEIPGHPGW